MKIKRILLAALPFLAFTITGCVKYNGRESSNPVERMTLTIDKTTLSVEEGKTDKITATVDRDVEVHWEVASEQVAKLDVESGLTVTVSALAAGQTTVTASASYKGRSYSQTCTVSVTRKGEGGGGGGGGGGEDIPQPGEVVTTYLVIGENGRYNGQQGTDIASLYLEYTVEFTAAVGTALPTETEITSTVDGSKFQYWQSYEGDGALTHWDKVPNARGKILYASFGGGSGSVDPGPGPQPQPTGSVTLYFAGISSWTEETTVHLGINNSFEVATKQADNNYKAVVQVTGSIKTVNAYLDQAETKYFHPTSGVKDYNDMYSTINTSDVNVELDKEYTITFTGWDYNKDDWSHAWFTYTFKEGQPSGEVTPTPEPETTVTTLYFAGIEAWTDATTVHLAIGDSWKVATKQGDGKYKAEFTASTVASIGCYMDQNNGGKYFHPYNGSYDKMNSTISVGTVSLVKGNSYVITFTDWHENHWETEGTVEHGWFDYTFELLAA